MKRHFVVGIVLATLIALISGCASMRAASAERRYIERATANYVHKRSLDAVLPEARKLLFEKGFQVRDSDGRSLETEYQQSRDSDVRYLVTSTKSGNGWKVHFTIDEVDARSDRAQTKRDLDMEWQLIGRVDRAWYNKTQREADAAGRAAR